MNEHAAEAEPPGDRPQRTADGTTAIVLVALLVATLAAVCAPLSPLFDPDEGYYPATAAETLRSGTFWDLRFNEAPRWDKPKPHTNEMSPMRRTRGHRHSAMPN